MDWKKERNKCGGRKRRMEKKRDEKRDEKRERWEKNDEWIERVK